MNRQELLTKLEPAAGRLLREKGYISCPDLFIALGCLDRRDYEAWRLRRVPYLERVIKLNLARIRFIMTNVRRNCLRGKLKPSWTACMSWGKGPKRRLRFSKSGSARIEQLWATHFVKPGSERTEAAAAANAPAPVCGNNKHEAHDR